MPDLIEKRISWYRSPLDKALQKELMARSDLKGLLQIIPQLALWIATGTFCYMAVTHSMPWPVILIAFFLHGTFFTFLGEHAAIHELSHGTVFKTKWLNEFFLRLCGFISWKNVVFYRVSHIRHHMATVHSDQDLEVPLPYQVSPLKWLGFYTVDLDRFKATTLQTLRHSVGILQGDWENFLFPESNEKGRRELKNYARTVVLGHLLIAAAFIYFRQWVLFAIFTFPCYATWLAWLVTIPQHAGLRESTTDFRLCCRSVKVDRFTLFLHWNMDYHIEHHMFAGIPFYNLPRLAAAVKDDYPTTERFFPMWKKLRGVMKQQKADPAYVYDPELPVASE